VTGEVKSKKRRRQEDLHPKVLLPDITIFVSQAGKVSEGSVTEEGKGNDDHRSWWKSKKSLRQCLDVGYANPR